MKRMVFSGRDSYRRTKIAAITGLLSIAAVQAWGASPAAVTPATMQKIGTVDERFQSYNMEMLEVTGGRFWAPYKDHKDAAAPPPAAGGPVGMDPSLYAYRPPLDLTNAKRRKLAAALGPAYIRVSGTWMNSTYFQDDDKPALKTPPTGFGGVLTRAQWKGVIDFAKAANAEIVTSVAISQGVRGADGVWTPVEAKKFFAYTKQAGGKIAAAEMFNEPSFAALGGASPTYDAENYGKDFKAFHAYMRMESPGTVLIGPGSLGETPTLGGGTPIPGMKLLSTESLLKTEGPGLDGFSYHFYGAVSQRCKAAGLAAGASPETALTSKWLNSTVGDYEFYANLRDRFEPGKPMWLTETAEAACGGDRWASDFIDSFRYLNQLGVLAKRGVQVVMHNTLDASDYSLIDETTLTPKPNYYAAVLWRRLMGTTVLEAGASPSEDLHLYAQCLRGKPGGVALLAINADKSAAAGLSVPMKSERYTLTAKELLSPTVDLNGIELKLGADDSLPKMAGVATKAGTVTFAPQSITFLAIPGAGNASCK